MLTRLAVEWASTLTDARLESLRQESSDRFRFVFVNEGVARHLVASLQPARPWIAEPAGRWDGPPWSPDRFVTAATRTLVGRTVVAVRKVPADRALSFDFGEGGRMVIELAPGSPNLVQVDPRGIVTGTLRPPVSDRDHRLTLGQPWSPRPIPHGRLDPFAMSADEIDLVAGREIESPGTGRDWLHRRFVGLGGVGEELIEAERAMTGRSLGRVVRARLDSLLDGTAGPVIEAPADGDDASHLRVLPWRLEDPPAGRRHLSRERPGATAGFYFETIEAADRLKARIGALGGILRRELKRAVGAERKVLEELSSFEDPERYRRMAESLIAGMSRARRAGENVIVSDPYDIDGGEIAIPAPADRPLSRTVDDLFRRHRRAKRGLESARARAEALRRREAALESLLREHERADDAAAAEALEAAMRSHGLAVGLTGATRVQRKARSASPPRVEGIRMITSADGWTILVGRTGPDNDRLTFKIASADDFWLHAAGVPGAHVVVRNPDRLASPPRATIEQAASLALWFSDARSGGAADVACTRRKNVRRAPKGRSGQVVLKRFITLRAQAQPPPGET